VSGDDATRWHDAGEQRALMALLRWLTPQLRLAPGQLIRDQLWTQERRDALIVVRALCARYGDNHWHDDLALAQILSEHLLPHLDPCGAQHHSPAGRGSRPNGASDTSRAPHKIPLETRAPDADTESWTP
jgi:hypothetical protein